jgi:hypothetical protein
MDPVAVLADPEELHSLARTAALAVYARDENARNKSSGKGSR